MNKVEKKDRILSSDYYIKEISDLQEKIKLMRFDYGMKSDEASRYRELAKSRQKVINNMINHAEEFKRDKDIIHIHKIIAYKREKRRNEE